MKTNLGKAGLLVGVFFLMPALVAAEMQMASFRKLFRPGEVSSAAPSNNLSECAPSVRGSIRKARREWGSFHFTCINGVVRNVFVYPESSIDRTPETFVEKNLGLFDIHVASITVRFDGEWGLQFYKGKPVLASKFFRQRRPGEIPLAGIKGGAPPVSTGDSEKAAGLKIKEFVIYELGLVDPEEDTSEDDNESQ